MSKGAAYVAAAALGQSGGAYETEIQIYRTDSEEMADSVSFGGELIYDLTFADEKTILGRGRTARALVFDGGRTARQL